MLSYCLKCRKTAENKNPTFAKANERKLIISLKCAVCSSKKSRFFKEKDL